MKTKTCANLDVFTKNFSPESCYILGILWADGYIEPKRNYVTIRASSIDIEALEYIFDKVGTWSKFLIKKRSNMRVQQKHLQLTSKELTSFLAQHNYLIKSGGSPEKILKAIPKEYVKYWLRGYLDGDGNIFYKPGNHIVSFTSVFNQDWNFLKSYGNELGIEFKFGNYVRKSGGRYSSAVLSSREKCLKFLDSIYNGYAIDKLGLVRKYEKYTKIKESLFKPMRYVFFLEKRNKWRTCIRRKGFYLYKESNTIEEAVAIRDMTLKNFERVSPTVD